MRLEVARIILFTKRMDEMTWFYRDVLGLEIVRDQENWREFDGGAVRIALHSGPPSPGARGPKVAFKIEDVPAAREELNKRGAKFGPVKKAEFTLCDATDPDGNHVQLSNR
jgi:catechol 2,3-dioxygenase-like lactoylglutathione lyase family enzyme